MIELHKQNQKADKIEDKPQQGKALSHDIPKLANTVIELSKDLIKILVREKDVVARKDLEEHKELLKAKQRLAMEYNTNIEILYSNKESLNDLPDEAKKSLRDAVRNVDTTAKENALVLQASSDASKQFISSVMSALKTERLSAPSYKNPKSSSGSKNDCEPISISKTV